MEENDNTRIPIRVLLVDNDKDHAQAMAESLERIGLDCTFATSGPEGAKLLNKNIYDIVVTDLMMNDVDGMEILKQAKESQPDCEVILVSGHATVARAVEAMRGQAFNFLEKPITPKRLQAVVSKAVDSVQLRQQNMNLHRRLDEKFGFENLMFSSDSMKSVVDRLRRIAPTDAGVLITGETGTGKDVVAQAIHQNSPRKKKPFVAINTAAVAEHLVESELFGHVKGAFTDAISDRQGKFEYANGGTLFLDEVGDMPMATQIKLLRVLEEREITRVGDNKPISVNVRVLAATNKDLEKEVEEERFRSDLYFRLKIVSVHLDPTFAASRRHSAVGRLFPQTGQQKTQPQGQRLFARTATVVVGIRLERQRSPIEKCGREPRRHGCRRLARHGRPFTRSCRRSTPGRIRKIEHRCRYQFQSFVCHGRRFFFVDWKITKRN